MEARNRDRADAAAPPQRRAVQAVLDRLSDRIDEGTRRHVPLGDVLDAIGERGFGPVFLALALLVISPFGGIPTVPTLMAAVMAMVAAQMLSGRRRLWLPRALSTRQVRGDHLARGVGWMRPAARWMDRRFGRRLVPLTSDAARRAAALAIIALCLVVPPLEVVPFAAVLPMSAIALFGLAITMRDGVVMVLAFIASAAGLIGGPWLLLSS
ncbi:Exopolysaccharide synthesis, ExoD [Roseivivax jejudonensis]|uniref:Exopolysaccharide synthesis, ExoD n=1 Tax=Roseivivax jejudonensis TaxID=1529041 RepID=A0A1X6ZSZ1_9RHOB|nr:exopolysaccharide biosynthesis protein [Roseivivax jejudonensis]SLN60453.1 Exopolysaccharide synthesis, ExoD [Roseivivax jejudonensis]